MYLAAVQKRFSLAGWGSATVGTTIPMVLEGMEKWWGRDGVAQKQAVEPEHIRALLLMDMPDEWTMAGEKGWRLAVAMVAIGYLCGLRSCEVVGLSACDVRWMGSGAEVAVNRTKNDQYGYKRTSVLEYSEDKAACPLRYVKSYAVDEGKAVPGGGCTRDQHPTLECYACPRLFENLLSGGVVRNDPESRGIRKYRVSALVKELYEQLAKRGVVAAADVALYSSKSLRAGAVTGAAAAGCRAKVTAGHMRMSDPATTQFYDRVLTKERGEVSRALNRLVGRQQ